MSGPLPMLDFLYLPDDRDRELFGDAYSPPERFEHGNHYPVATYRKEEGGDGQDAVICECRLPARFFRLEVLPDKDSLGNDRPGFALSTGSGDEAGRLMVAIAKAAAEGMVGMERKSAAIALAVPDLLAACKALVALAARPRETTAESLNAVIAQAKAAVEKAEVPA